MRWSGEASVGQPLAPIRLPFKVGPMTGRAPFGVDHLPASGQRRIIRVRLRRLIARDQVRERCSHKQNGGDNPGNQRSSDGPHLDRLDRRYLMSAAAARTRTTISRSQISPALYIIPPMPSIMRSMIDL